MTDENKPAGPLSWECAHLGHDLHATCNGWTYGLYEAHPCTCKCGCTERATDANKPQPGQVWRRLTN